MSAFVPEHDLADARKAGLGYGVLAYVWWGLAPLYFKALDAVRPDEILAHRIVWSAVLLVVIVAARGRMRDLALALRSRRILLPLVATTTLISVNWFTYIWAIANHQLIEASLGYFINPLVNVLLGALLLKEKLRRDQWIGVALVGAAVGFLTWQTGRVPLVSMILALTFAFYGLVRKVAPIDALVGLAVETLLLFVPSLGYLFLLQQRGTLAFGYGSTMTSALLALAGVLTALPLLWFGLAARRLRYVTVGFLQYLAPTLQFLLAAFAFGEPVSWQRTVSFGLIWVAIAIYSVGQLHASRTTTGTSPA